MKREEVKRLFAPHLVGPKLGEEHTNRCGTVVFTHFKRVVYGERGPYIELLHPLILCKLTTKQGEEWRSRSKRAFYLWLETDDGCRAKVYHQTRKVSYADYVPGRYYVDPRDLLIDGVPIMSKPELYELL